MYSDDSNVNVAIAIQLGNFNRPWHWTRGKKRKTTDETVGLLGLLVALINAVQTTAGAPPVSPLIQPPEGLRSGTQTLHRPQSVVL